MNKTKKRKHYTLILIICALILLLSTASCNKIDPESQMVIDQIASLGNPSLDNKDSLIKLVSVRKSYDDLTEKQKSQVSNYNDLANVENKLNAEMKNRITNHVEAVRISVKDCKDFYNNASDFFNSVSGLDSNSQILYYSFIFAYDEKYDSGLTYASIMSRAKSSYDKLLDSLESDTFKRLENIVYLDETSFTMLVEYEGAFLDLVKATTNQFPDSSWAYRQQYEEALEQFNNLDKAIDSLLK